MNKNSEHYGDDYPWHTKTLKELMTKLESLSQNLNKEARISLRELFTKKFQFLSSNFIKL